MKAIILALVCSSAANAYRLSSDKYTNLMNEIEVDDRLVNSIRVDARDIPELSAGDSNGIYSDSESAVIPYINNKVQSSVGSAWATKMEKEEPAMSVIEIKK